METTLAALPTVVVYRANRVTELIALQLAAVRFVSIPNLLLGRYVAMCLFIYECVCHGGLEELTLDHVWCGLLQRCDPRAAVSPVYGCEH